MRIFTPRYCFDFNTKSEVMNGQLIQTHYGEIMLFIWSVQLFVRI